MDGKNIKYTFLLLNKSQVRNRENNYQSEAGFVGFNMPECMTFYGKFSSANTVLKNNIARDRLN